MPQQAFNEHGQVTVAIKCHWCGNTGSTVWERTETGRQFVTLDGFYERMKNRQPFQIETVCNSCNRAQPV